MHKNEKLLLFGIMFCMFVGLTGYSFAYFVKETRVEGSGTNVGGTTAELIKVVYDAGASTLDLVNATPKMKASKNFAITITPTEDQKTVKYAIKLNIEGNTFEKCSDDNYDAINNACLKDAEEIVYYLKDNSNQILATGDITGKTGEFVLYTREYTVSNETIINYTLEIEYKDTNSDQNHNMNKTLNGIVKVEFAK